ncbi:MAG: glycosyltransferase family 2 protein [bacterium]|nr:glycosyltransferase family 2 protein [bacterium]
MSTPKIFIIILNYNGQEVLKKTLSSVFQVDYPNFEIVLVDNNSKDGSFEEARRIFPKIACIKNSENLGFSAGNNIGIEYALERGADYVLLLNYDAVVKKDFLWPLIDLMDKNKKVGIASPVILKNETSNVWFSGGKIKWLKMKTEHQENNLKENYFHSDYITGCSMIIKKEVFRKIGLLDEDYFLYWEDADFSIRAKRAGYKLAVCAGSHVWHLEKSQEKKANKIYWLVLSGLIFFRKNSPMYLRPWLFVYVLLRKIKNRKDVKRQKTPINESVQKAYRDFKKVI